MGIETDIPLVGFPGGTSGKELPTNAGDVRDASSIPGWERSPGGGHGGPFQHSCLENPRAEEPGGFQRVTKSQTRLSEHARAHPTGAVSLEAPDQHGVSRP